MRDPGEGAPGAVDRGAEFHGVPESQADTERATGERASGSLIDPLPGVAEVERGSPLGREELGQEDQREDDERRVCLTRFLEYPNMSH